MVADMIRKVFLLLAMPPDGEVNRGLESKPGLMAMQANDLSRRGSFIAEESRTKLELSARPLTLTS